MTTESISNNNINGILELYNISCKPTKTIMYFRCLTWIGLILVSYSHVITMWGRSVDTGWLITTIIGATFAFLGLLVSQKSLHKSTVFTKSEITLPAVISAIVYVCLLYNSFYVVFTKHEYSWGAWLMPIASLFILLFSGQAFFNELHRIAFIKQGWSHPNSLDKYRENFNGAIFESTPDIFDSKITKGDCLFCAGIWMFTAWFILMMNYQKFHSNIMLLPYIACTTVLISIYMPARIVEHKNKAMVYIALNSLPMIGLFVLEKLGDCIFLNESITPLISVAITATTIAMFIAGLRTRYNSKNIFIPHLSGDINGGLFFIGCLIVNAFVIHESSSFWGSLAILVNILFNAMSMYWYFVRVLMLNKSANYEYKRERKIYLENPEEYHNELYPYKIFMAQGAKSSGVVYLKQAYKKSIQSCIKRNQVSDCVILKYKTQNQALKPENIEKLNISIDNMPVKFYAYIYMFGETEYNQLLNENEDFDRKYCDHSATVMAVILPLDAKIY